MQSNTTLAAIEELAQTQPNLNATIVKLGEPTGIGEEDTSCTVIYSSTIEKLVATITDNCHSGYRNGEYAIQLDLAGRTLCLLITDALTEHEHRSLQPA